MVRLPLDATPDLSDTQVIIFSHWDRSPDIAEDQVMYPIVTAMLGAPKVKAVRGVSDFGYSYVYVVFEEGTDLYWARSRIMKCLSGVLSRLAEGVKAELGPDATALGWVFQYVFENPSAQHSLADLRSYQDWYLNYYLQSVPGVAGIAPIGGHTHQYQVNLDPNRLRACGIPVSRVVDAVRSGNRESSGRILEFGGTGYMVRGRGYARSLEDFENIPLSVTDTGSQIRVKDVGQVVMGPDLRRGLADLDVFMLLYLDLAYQEAQREGPLTSFSQVREAMVQGAAKRLRPKFMTLATTCIGLFPILWATGAGSDVMKRIAALMVGGIFTSFLLELLVYPAIYEVWRWGSDRKNRSAIRSLELLELQPQESSSPVGVLLR